MVSEHTIGPHRYVIDEDLIHNMADPGSTMELVHMQAYTAMCDPVIARYGRIFMLTDGRAMFKVSAKARRHLAEWPRGAQIAASAIYGSNLATRTVVQLIGAAMNMLGSNRGKPAINYAFFATEAEARDWLVKERAKLTTPQGSGAPG
jgi:hypothetical protein